MGCANLAGENRAEALALLRQIAARSGRPYDLAVQLWRLSMRRVDRDGDWIYHPLWLLWGALTDWAENKPAEAAQAEDIVVAAAEAFLAIMGHEAAERTYFDHWLYERIGYERPSATEAAEWEPPERVPD